MAIFSLNKSFVDRSTHAARAQPFCVLRARRGSAGGDQQREAEAEQTKAREVEMEAYLEQRAAAHGIERRRGRQ